MADNQNSQTQQDHSKLSDTELAHRSIKRVEARHAGAPQGTLTQAKAQEAAATGKGLPYKFFKPRNPEYDAGYWRILRALYSGGKKLLGDLSLMRQVFPRHRDEHESVYEERIKRAFYTPYPGEIIDHIISALASQKITLTTDCEHEDNPDHPAWYDEFYKDCSPAGGKEVSFHDLLKESMLTAQQCKCAWVLVDLPDQRDEEGNRVIYPDRATQEDGGALEAYAVPIEPECVIDWEEDEAGELEWALIHTVKNKREGLTGTRDYITQCWTYYDRETWYRYEIRHKADQTPEDDAIVSLVVDGTHTFGAVPLVRLRLPDGLWTMAKLEGIAREHFNKRSGLAWGELQSLLPELYEFQGPEDGIGGGVVVSAAQEDASRATNQPRGQGFVQVRGHLDQAKFIGPDPKPFTEVRASCKELRDEMHRVTHQMALSTDNGAAALGRSADSKAMDSAATTVVLIELGKLLRGFAERIYRMVSRGRAELDLVPLWNAQGMEKFDDVQVADEIDQALIIDQLGLESPTFRRRHRFNIIKMKLGDSATQEDLDQIESELEINITDEWPPAGMVMNPEDPGARPNLVDSEDDGEDDDEMMSEPVPPKPGKPATAGRRMGGSGKM